MYWELQNFPKIYREYDRLIKDGRGGIIGGEPRIYFAYDGMVRGYFIVDSWVDKGWFYVEFYSNTWVNIEPIPTKPHRGFKYIEVLT